MPFNKPKFKEALLYAAWHLREEPEGGAVVLNKVMYYAEFGHMRQFGETITGARYFLLSEGPAPRALLPVRNELIEDGAAHLDKTPFNGKIQDRLIPSHEPRISELSVSEMNSIDEALVLLKGKTAREVSDMSHLELGWRFVDHKEDIPFETAFLSPDTFVTSGHRAHAAELAGQSN